jgi:hypothetical protein
MGNEQLIISLKNCQSPVIVKYVLSGLGGYEILINIVMVYQFLGPKLDK